MAFDINALSQEDIEQLRAKIGVTTPQEALRQGMRKHLTDLRAPQTAAGRLYRPHFEFSADDPGGQVIPPFPRLYWNADGVECRFESQADMDAKMAADPKIHLLPPNVAPLTKQQQIEKELAMLSPDDRQFLLEAQKTARINRVQELMSGLSPDESAAMMAVGQSKKKPS